MIKFCESTLEDACVFRSLSLICLLSIRFLASFETPPVYEGVSSDLRITFLSGLELGFRKPEAVLVSFSEFSSRSRSSASFNFRLLSER